MSNPVCSPEIINCVCGMMMMSGQQGFSSDISEKNKWVSMFFFSQRSLEGLRYWKIREKNGSEGTTM